MEWKVPLVIGTLVYGPQPLPSLIPYSEIRTKHKKLLIDFWTRQVKFPDKEKEKEKLN
jgi:hypothetical protein